MNRTRSKGLLPSRMVQLVQSVLLAWCTVAAGATGADDSASKPWESGPNAPQASRFKLANGMSVCVFQIPNEPLFSVISYTPGGLAVGGQNQTVLMNMLEQMLTQSWGGFTSRTRIDCLAIESWSRPEQWEQTLADHARVLEAGPLNADDLPTYRESMTWMVRDHASYFYGQDYGTAVFLQALRRGCKSVSVKSELLHTQMSDLISLRDSEWGRTTGACVCIFTHLPIEKIKPKIVESFGKLADNPRAGQARTLPVRKRMRVSWDYPHPFIVLAWPVGEPSVQDLARLLLAQQMFRLDWVHENGAVQVEGLLRADAITRLPEGNFFIATLALPEDSNARDFENRLDERLTQWARDPRSWTDFGKYRDSLIEELLCPSKVPTLDEIVAKYEEPRPERVFQSWFDIRREWALSEWCLREQREEICRELAHLTPEDLKPIFKKYLSPGKCIRCTVESDPKLAHQRLTE